MISFRLFPFSKQSQFQNILFWKRAQRCYWKQQCFQETSKNKMLQNTLLFQETLTVIYHCFCLFMHKEYTATEDGLQVTRFCSRLFFLFFNIFFSTENFLFNELSFPKNKVFGTKFHFIEKNFSRQIAFFLYGIETDCFKMGVFSKFYKEFLKKFQKTYYRKLKLLLKNFLRGFVILHKKF